MFNTFVWSKEQLNRFYTYVMPRLENLEVYFISMAARNKYLTEPERKTYSLGRTEMMERRTIRVDDFNRFYRTIRKFETHEDAFLTKEGNSIPEKCMVVYANINPSSIIKAYHEFEKITNDYIREYLINAYQKSDSSNIEYRFSKIDKLLMTAIQKSPSRKVYIDIDFDLCGKFDSSFIDSFQNTLNENNKKKLPIAVLKTKSGYHVLIQRSELQFNYTEVVNQYDKFAKKVFDKEAEVVVNKNDMVPVPGTHQASFPVELERIDL